MIACRNGGMYTARGGAIRDSTGNWLVGFKSGVVGYCSWSRGFRKVWVESDSLTAVNMVKRGCPADHHLYGLIQNIISMCRREWQVKLSHIHREGNFVVHVLANEGLNCSHGTIILDTPLLFVLML